MQILLQKSHFIHKLLFISTLTIVRVHKRFYPGGKEVGHASKILNAAKLPIVPSIPSTATQQPTSFPKSMTSITSQGPSNPSFPKSSITTQNYAAQKSLQQANDHKTLAQTHSAKHMTHLPQQAIVDTKDNFKSPLLITYPVHKNLTESLKIEVSDISEPQDSFVFPNLLSTKYAVQPSLANASTKFNQDSEQCSEEIMKTIKDFDKLERIKNQQNFQIIAQFMKYHLLKFDENTGEKLTKESLLTWKKPYKKTVSINLSEEINNCKFEFGLLKVHNKDETLLLPGLYKHVIVLYTTVNYQKIVWGYLTSEKGKCNTLLSDYQPFMHNLGKKKDQYLYTIKEPIIVNNFDINQLPEEIRVMGQNYLVDNGILQILTTCFDKQTVPLLKNPIGVYDGLGLTSENLKEILSQYTKREDKLGLKWFNDLKSCVTEKQKNDFWADREKDKHTHVRAHEHLNNSINNEENKCK